MIFVKPNYGNKQYSNDRGLPGEFDNSYTRCVLAERNRDVSSALFHLAENYWRRREILAVISSFKGLAEDPFTILPYIDATRGRAQEDAANHQGLNSVSALKKIPPRRWATLVEKMTTPHSILMLHTIARDYYAGNGELVGFLMGNHCPCYSYIIFRLEE